MNTRAQANLVSFAAAVVLISVVTVAGVVVAEEALSDAAGQSQNERVASVIATYLVSDSASHTHRHGVLHASDIKSLTITNLTTAVPSLAGRSARVSIHDTPIIDRGTPTKSLIRRRVLIESYTTRSQDIVLANVSGSESSNISIPEHLGDVTVSILPTTNRTVQTIRADGRIVRHNPAGLSVQKHHISSSRHPLNLSIVSTGNTSGKLLIAWQTADTTLAWVEVRVGE
jgi:hypothetical protein